MHVVFVWVLNWPAHNNAKFFVDIKMAFAQFALTWDTLTSRDNDRAQLHHSSHFSESNKEFAMLSVKHLCGALDNEHNRAYYVGWNLTCKCPMSQTITTIMFLIITKSPPEIVCWFFLLYQLMYLSVCLENLIIIFWDIAFGLSWQRLKQL